MNASAFFERYSRAIITVTAVLAAAGLLSALSLPSDIYPPLVFPRVVAIGHSGTLPARTMTSENGKRADRWKPSVLRSSNALSPLVSTESRSVNCRPRSSAGSRE